MFVLIFCIQTFQLMTSLVLSTLLYLNKVVTLRLKLYQLLVWVGYYYFFSSQVRRSIVYGDRPRNRYPCGHYCCLLISYSIELAMPMLILVGLDMNAIMQTRSVSACECWFFETSCGIHNRRSMDYWVRTYVVNRNRWKSRFFSCWSLYLRRGKYSLLWFLTIYGAVIKLGVHFLDGD